MALLGAGGVAADSDAEVAEAGHGVDPPVDEFCRSQSNLAERRKDAETQRGLSRRGYFRKLVGTPSSAGFDNEVCHLPAG
jgi:hypothetical protein